jgi:hypothetical protein
MVAGSFRSTCQDARGLRAGATIAVLGGPRAEGGTMTRREQEQLDRFEKLLDRLEAALFRPPRTPESQPTLRLVEDERRAA